MLGLDTVNVPLSVMMVRNCTSCVADSWSLSSFVDSVGAFLTSIPRRIAPIQSAKSSSVRMKRCSQQNWTLSSVTDDPSSNPMHNVSSSTIERDVMILLRTVNPNCLADITVFLFRVNRVESGTRAHLPHQPS